MDTRKKRIKKSITDGEYSIYFIILFIGFYVLNFLLNKTYVFYSNISSIEKIFAISFVIINFILAFLFALTINLVIIKFKETRNFNKTDGGIATAGIVGAIIGGGCPACFVGVLPAIIGFFGLGISFADYPYLGIGIQVVSGVILLFSVYLLSADPVCKIPIRKK